MLNVGVNYGCTAYEPLMCRRLDHTQVQTLDQFRVTSFYCAFRRGSRNILPCNRQCNVGLVQNGAKG